MFPQARRPSLLAMVERRPSAIAYLEQEPVELG